MLTIVTWNVNGVRALKGPLKRHLDVLNSDVICLQETKVTSTCNATQWLVYRQDGTASNWLRYRQIAICFMLKFFWGKK